jgi:hypothetical protein
LPSLVDSILHLLFVYLFTSDNLLVNLVKLTVVFIEIPKILSTVEAEFTSFQKIVHNCQLNASLLSILELIAQILVNDLLKL